MGEAVDLLIKGARVVDPGDGFDEVADLAVAGGRIVERAPDLSPDRAGRVVSGDGLVLLPGVIDSHVHIHEPHAPRSMGHRRLAVAGVTTAVEFAFMRGVLDQWAESSAGLTVLGIQAMPAYTGATPRAQIRDDVAAALRDGCIGVKVLGGHYPSTPEASATIIEEADEQEAYLGFHSGTTAHGSDLDGMREALELAGNHPIHLAHTNAYLRGAVDDPMTENLTALQLLRAHPRVVSETHLGPLNMCHGTVHNGELADHIARNCLRLRGYEPSPAGLRQAFLDGYAHALVDGGPTPVPGPAGLAHWKARPDGWISFPVNLRMTAYLQACARVDPAGELVFEGPGDFVVDAISSDGGLWRNVILDQGLAMVQLGALSLLQLAVKTSLRPAEMFGLVGKGELSPGADADLVLVDPHRRAAVLTVADGRVIAENGQATGRGGVILTSAAGAARLAERGLPHRVHDLSGSLFRTRGAAHSMSS